MRASIIIISRLVDAVQIRQGILAKRVYAEENYAVVFALLAAAVNLFWTGPGDFEFVQSVAAMSILGSYIFAYAIRIYIMNYYKNTRGKGAKLDNQGFFAIEQIAASATMLIVGYALFQAPGWSGSTNIYVLQFRNSIAQPQPMWYWAVIAGFAYGMVAFFSVFISCSKVAQQLLLDWSTGSPRLSPAQRQRWFPRCSSAESFPKCKIGSLSCSFSSL